MAEESGPSKGKSPRAGTAPPSSRSPIRPTMADSTDSSRFHGSAGPISGSPASPEPGSPPGGPAPAPPKPIGISAPHGARIFTIRWAGGASDALPHSILRGYCPCAGCQGHSGRIAFQAGRDLDLREVKAVGNYALALTWGDGHSSGIYSFDYLHRLGRLFAEHGEEGFIALGHLPTESQA